jgi:ribosomal protein S18 acetylase RimI-like enzyme
MNALQGIVRRSQLTKQELDDIKVLEDICSDFENITLKLNWSMLRDHARDTERHVFYYDNGVLVGFLGLYYFGRDEIEASGMVHPKYRRRGIYRKLVQAAQEECSSRSISRLILICPGNSASGHAFCKEIRSDYSFTEYYMERNDDTLAKSPSILGLEIRQAVKDDLDAIAKLNKDGFDMPLEDAANFASSSLLKGDTLIAELNGTAIGKLNFRETDHHAFIYGFVVDKELRGKGYGRNILMNSVVYSQEKMNKRHQSLEVAATNDRALGLYKSCGFVKHSKIDYYELKKGVHF